MAEDQAPAPAPPTRSEVRAYIEDMALELADMAAAQGETALAAALAAVALQAAGAPRGIADAA